MKVSVALVAILVMLSTVMPVEHVEGAPLSRRQNGATRRAGAARPKNALRQLLTPKAQGLGLKRTRMQQADEASDTTDEGGNPPQNPEEVDGVLAPKFYPVGPVEPVEPGLGSSESERHGGGDGGDGGGGGGGREDEEEYRGGDHRGYDDEDDGDDGRRRGGQDYGDPDDYDSRRGAGDPYDREERARAEQDQEEEERRRRQQEAYDPYGSHHDPYGGHRDPYGDHRDPYGGHRDPYGGHQESYGGEDHRDPYGGHRDPYSNEHNPYASSRSYNPYHEYQQQQYERLREYQDRYMRMMEELGVPGVWVDGRFRRQDNAEHEGVHEAYYAARGPYSRHPYDY